MSKSDSNNSCKKDEEVIAVTMYSVLKYLFEYKEHDEKILGMLLIGDVYSSIENLEEALLELESIDQSGYLKEIFMEYKDKKTEASIDARSVLNEYIDEYFEPCSDKNVHILDVIEKLRFDEDSQRLLEDSYEFGLLNYSNAHKIGLDVFKSTFQGMIKEVGFSSLMEGTNVEKFQDLEFVQL